MKKTKEKIRLTDLGKCEPSTDCCSPQSNVPASDGIYRRDFLKALGLAAGGVTMGLPMSLNATDKFEKETLFNVPLDKKLNSEWLKSLYERGSEEIYTGRDLAYIGMPVGGLCAGQVYLGGDGKLWLWDIFNEQKEGVIAKTVRFNGKRVRTRDGSNYVAPSTQEYPFEQGFGLKITSGERDWTRSLDYEGFSDIQFKGQYPVAEVKYNDSDLPVQVKLNSFSPFIPLDFENSSYPATIMQFSVTNSSDEEIDCEVSGWLENSVLHQGGNINECQLRNRIIQREAMTSLVCDALPTKTSTAYDIKNQSDYGDMSLTVLENNSAILGHAGVESQGSIPLPESSLDEQLSNLDNPAIGTLSKSFKLAPNETKTTSFLITWYFPNLYVRNKREGRYYAKRFKNALDIAQHIGSNFEHLAKTTQLWKETWYDQSTLPHWLLNRTFYNTSTLATETCYQFEDGRFWAWEGIGCCPGTCTHVWHYAQAVGRIFPELERNLREKTDFTEALNQDTGAIDFRGGLAGRDAADGQAGIIMRSYREHQMSKDNEFLKRNWDSIKGALGYLMSMDKASNGILTGEQHNTLDAEWYGRIPVITSLYLCALASGKAMADEMNDVIFSNRCADILQKGAINIEALFNGEYFVQEEDPSHSDAIGIGTGCYIDNVFGQGWAFQLGLGRLYNKEMIRKSLSSLYKYNYIPDMGEYRAALPASLAGRPYALDGESGLVICTWPKGGKRDDWEKHWQFGYFNECMTGFEYQAASHMVWEDLLEEGLTVAKSVHDRYHPSKRNPYNEVECSDHYARAMSSFGVYVAVCAYKYHGPSGTLSFAPKISPENFSSAFTGSEGWGNFSQKINQDGQTEEIAVKFGLLNLNKTSFELPEGRNVKKITCELQSKRIKVTHKMEGSKIIIELVDPLQLKARENLKIEIKFKA